MCPVLIAQGGSALLIGGNDQVLKKQHGLSLQSSKLQDDVLFDVSLRAKPPPSCM